jgi:hypothetical protein
MIISDVNNYISIDTKGKSKTKGKFEFHGMDLGGGKKFSLPLHKNKSHTIIPMAVYEYFVNNKPVEETVRNHTNIFDFCAGVRAKKSEGKGQSRYELHSIENEEKTYTKEEKRRILRELGYEEFYQKDFYKLPNSSNMAGISIDDFKPRHNPLVKERLSKTVRYFISKKGKYLMKLYEDGSISHVEAPLKVSKIQKEWKVTYFNKAFKLDNIEEYDIDYSYYIYYAKKWISDIEIKEQLTLF